MIKKELFEKLKNVPDNYEIDIVYDVYTDLGNNYEESTPLTHIEIYDSMKTVELS